MVTGTTDYTRSVATGLATTILSLGTMTMVMSPKKESGMGSQLIRDSNYLYYASRDILLCIDIDGNGIWQAELPKDSGGSASKLILLGDSIYLVNRGYIHSDNRYILSGKPYIASFNKKNGKQNYTVDIPTKDWINDIYTTTDTMFLFCGDSYIVYQLSNGNAIATKNVSPTEIKGWSLSHYPDDYFIQSEDSTFATFPEKFYTKFFFTSKDSVKYFSTNLHSQGSFPYSKLWVNNIDFGSFISIANNQKSYIIKNKQKVAELNMSKQAKKIGKYAGRITYDFVWLADLSTLQ